MWIIVKNPNTGMSKVYIILIIIILYIYIYKPTDLVIKVFTWFFDNIIIVGWNVKSVLKNVYMIGMEKRIMYICGKKKRLDKN